MELFTLEVCNFLNNLDEYIPQLMKEQSLNIILKNVLLDIQGFILYANEYAILNRIAQFTIKSFYNIDHLHTKVI